MIQILGRFLLLLFILSLASCRSTQRLVKAFPAEPSTFLENGQRLTKTDATRSPFLMEWKNPDADAWTEAAKRTRIHIHPVCMKHLRPMTRPLSKIEVREASRRKQCSKLAAYFEKELRHTFKAHASGTHWEIVDQPAPDGLTLEIAIIELNPNPISGGLLRKGINILLWPGAETVMSHKLKGNMAIEGRLRDEVTKKTLYEFADAEQNRSGIILYYHDYTNFSYFRKAVREWAKQIEQTIRTQAETPVKDGPPATFLLW